MQVLHRGTLLIRVPIENWKNMKRLTVAAAAFAAGMLTIVAQSQAESVRNSLRVDGLAAGKADKSTKAVKAGKEEAADAAKASGKAEQDKTMKLASARAKRGKQGKQGKKGRVKVELERAGIDKVKTASVRTRPQLKAVARDAVKGLQDGSAGGKVASAAGYTTIVAHYATTYGVPASLAHAVISVESNYRPNARGSAGEIGLMQIKPATARAMGYSGSASGLFDPETNIKYGMKYLALAHQLSGGATCGTILKYNAGHGARRMNPVSAAYCSKVKALLPG
jgi:soluble lytic murein transglycosylase-like protein